MSSSSAAFSIKFGADTKQLEKALKNTERQLGKTAKKLNKIGASFTKSITLPLLALGAAAVKSAVDMQTLETSFKSLTGGAEQAADMVDQLNKFAASTPYQIEGIATAARQLIASGTDIGQVTNTLKFLGDIAAASGGQIEEIASIFSKVKAKGKVELESINQLAERGIPIFKLLAEATGLPADKLGAGAVSVEQFEAVLRNMAEAGGIAEGAMLNLSQTAGGKFSTALDNLKIAGAKLGDALLPVIETLLDDVTELAQDFAALDKVTQKSILKWGAYAAAIGPAIQGLGGMVMGIQGVTRAYRSLRTSQTAASLLSKANPYVLAAAAIAAIAIAIYNTSDAFKGAQTSAEKYQATIAGVKANVKKQSTEVRYLVERYKDEKLSLEERERILKRLKTIDETHFSNLEAENTSYVDLKTNLDNYTNSLRKSYIEKAMSEEGSSLFSQLAADENALQQREIMLQRMQDVVDDAGKLTRKAAEKNLADEKYFHKKEEEQREKTLVAIDDFEQRKVDLLKKYAGLAAEEDSEEEGSGLVVIPESTTTELTDLEKLLDDVAETKARIAAIDLFTPDELAKQEALAKALADASISAQLLGHSLVALQYDEEADAAGRLADKLKLANEQLEKKRDLINQYGTDISGLLTSLNTYTAAVETNSKVEAAATDVSEAFSNMLVNGAQAIGSAVRSVNDALRGQQKMLSDQFAAGELTAEDYHEKLAELEEQAKQNRRSAVQEAITQMFVQAAAQVITNAYQSAAAAGPAAAYVGPVLAVAGMATLTQLWASSFASGGMVTGETLALVGDNQSGKEAIIPFERMGEFLGQFSTGDAQHIVVSGRLSGSDILLSAERSKRGTQRLTGVSF